MTERPESDYSQGLAAGRIAERLDSHDKHFAVINGSIGDLREEVHLMRMDVQRLGDAANADRTTVKTTATALEKADQARRDSAVQRWSPMAKSLAVVGGLTALILAAVAVYSLGRG